VDIGLLACDIEIQDFIDDYHGVRS
jgi:hypothetical protein